MRGKKQRPTNKNITSSNGNNKIVKKRRENRDLTRTKKSFYFLLVTVVMFLLIFCGGMYITNELTSEKDYKMSEIIRMYVNYSDKIVEWEGKLKLLIEAPIFPINNDELRPIQAIVSSLRTQTSQYEKMERIPGGPTFFIESSLKKLDQIMDTDLNEVDLKAMYYIAQFAHNINVLTEQGEEIHMEKGKFINIDLMSFLNDEHFMLLYGHDEKSELEELEQLVKSNYTTMAKGRRKLLELAEIYEKMEEIDKKIAHNCGFESKSKFWKYLNSGSATKEEMDRFHPELKNGLGLRKIFHREKKRYLKTYKVFIFMGTQLWENMRNHLKNSESYEEEKRSQFTTLFASVIKDINNVKIRIENLKYTYAKSSIVYFYDS